MNLTENLDKMDDLLSDIKARTDKVTRHKNAILNLEGSIDSLLNTNCVDVWNSLNEDEKSIISSRRPEESALFIERGTIRATELEAEKVVGDVG